MLRERRYPQWLLSLEESHKTDLAQVLAEVVTQKGVARAAEALGTNKSNLCYWMSTLGVATAFVALAPGDVLDLKRGDGTVRRIVHKGLNDDQINGGHLT